VIKRFQADRRSRVQRQNDAIAVMSEIQVGYAAWFNPVEILVDMTHCQSRGAWCADHRGGGAP
jgi:hypothetical protein